MSTHEMQKNDMIEMIRLELKEASKWGITLHQSVADSLKLNITDHKCLDFILEKGSVTAGELSTFTGLTTGATTALIDRLEAEGYVIRDRDSKDRRRVIIRPLVNAVGGNVNSIFEAMNSLYDELLSTYTKDELGVVMDFFKKSNKGIQLIIKNLKILEGGNEGTLED